MAVVHLVDDRLAATHHVECLVFHPPASLPPPLGTADAAACSLDMQGIAVAVVQTREQDGRRGEGRQGR